jgi:Family of unknown function (DUF6174)
MSTRLAVIALLLMTSPACDEGPNAPDPPGGDVASNLERAERQWAANKPVVGYDFRVRIGCFCPPPRDVRFEVRGDVSSAPDLPPGDQARVAAFQSVDALFALLHDRLDRSPARFEVDYHPTFGYPLKAYLDGSVNIADDELTFEVPEFAAVR